MEKYQQKPIVISPIKSLEIPDFKEVLDYKDLLFFLVKRDLVSRFQQTTIGVLWIALQPILQMLIFYAILGIIIKVPTGETPYHIFFLTGFIVYQLFNQIVNASAFSLLSHIGVITKIYFPRLTLPLSSTISSLVDFIVSFLVLLIFLLANDYPVTIRYLYIPLLVIFTMLLSSSVGLIFGALMVIFRDTKNLLGFILMIWMYATPIIYPINLVPENYRVILHLNPLTPLVEFYRWVFLGEGVLPSLQNGIISFVVVILFWFIGAILFKTMENKIADVM